MSTGYNKWRRLGDSDSWESYVVLRRSYKSLVQKSKRESWINFCDSIDDVRQTSRFMKIIKGSASAQLGALIGPDDVTHSTPEDIIRVMASAHFPGHAHLGMTIVRLSSIIPEEKPFLQISEVIQIQSNSKPDVPSSGGTSVAHRRTQIYALIPIYLLQFCYGMNTGFPAILTPQLRENCSEFSINDNQESWIVSLDNVATPIVCLFSGILQQKFGPKLMLLSACLPYVSGWLLVIFAGRVEDLYLSRILVGVSHALITTTVYTVEITSPDMRGTLSLWESVIRCAGCLLVYCLGFFMRWNKIAMLAPLVPILALVTCWCIPESPVYLVQQRRLSKASRSLKQLFGPRFNAQEEIELISENLEDSQGHKHLWEVTKSLPSHPEVYKPFGIIILLSLIQQFSGMSILRAYVIKIFDEIFNEEPVDSEEDCGQSQISQEAYISAIVIGLVRLLSSLLLSSLLRRFPRRSLYLTSLGLTIISLVAFATIQLLNEGPQRWLVLTSACLLVFSVQLGVQTLPLLLSGELFTSESRALCKGVARSFTCILLVICLKVYPWLEIQLDIHGTFYLFSIILTLSAPFVYWLLPETKDLSLEVIQHYFKPYKTIFYVDLPKTN
eukprot:maker-scaffold150_size309978-snap-gene-2.13 protein:Tk09111 transcript:maker-scaffold150_size309978-snap-gene-2.13-mRNA-1 annotation:"sugar transporter 12"